MASSPTETTDVSTASEPARRPMTGNTWLRIGAGVFLGLAALATALVLSIPVKGGLQGSQFYPVIGAGMIGLTFLLAALGGLGSGTVLEPHGRAVRNALATLEAATMPSAAPAGPALAHFEGHGRALKGSMGKYVYRVYLTDHVLVFASLHKPFRTVDERSRTQMLVVGGAAGGLVAGLGGYLEHREQQQGLHRRRLLDGVSDVGVLRRFAEEDPESFVVPADGLQEVRVDGPTVWDQITSWGEIRGKVRFVHRDLGTVTVDLCSYADASTAVRELRGRFGDTLPVNLSC
jgi:hypothetical protein